MSVQIVFHELAERELNETAAYYRRGQPRLGQAFLDAVERAVDAARDNPLAGRLVSKEIRWWLVRRFPYAVIYRVFDGQLRVLAIAASKRRPFYWRTRR